MGCIDILPSKGSQLYLHCILLLLHATLIVPTGLLSDGLLVLIFIAYSVLYPPSTSPSESCASARSPYLY